MFLKTESFEHNGVTVTLSELSALQRIEHLALMKRQAEQAESDMKNISFSFENGRIISNVENCVFNQTVIGGKYIVSLCRIINE